MRWPFSNYVSTCSWDVCQACEDDDDQIEVFIHTEVCDPEGLTTVLIGSIKYSRISLSDGTGWSTKYLCQDHPVIRAEVR